MRNVTSWGKTREDVVCSEEAGVFVVEASIAGYILLVDTCIRIDEAAVGGRTRAAV
jgi:hypothetical protein